MGNRSWFAAVLGAVALVHWSVQAEAGSRWRTVEGDGFTARFPGEAVAVKKDDVTHYLASDGFNRYSISVVRLASAPGDAEKALEDYRQATQPDATVLSKDPFLGRASMIFEARSPAGTRLGQRAVASGDRLYVIGVEWPASQVVPSDLAAFEGSVRLTGPAAAAAIERVEEAPGPGAWSGPMRMGVLGIVFCVILGLWAFRQRYDITLIRRRSRT